MSSPDSAVLDGSWVDELPPSFESQVTGDESDMLPSNDDVKIVNPPANACNVCGEEIVRLPGQRGRLAKTHPECKAQLKGSSATKTVRTPRATKADIEKEAVVVNVLERFGGALNRAIVLLSLVDPYDALVVKVNAPDILSNLRALLWKYDKFRALANAAETGGSIVGLGIALLTTVLPIMAHHNLIPSKKVAALLMQAPIVMFNVQRMAEESETGDFTLELLRRVQENHDRAMRAQAQAKDSANGNSSTSST